MKKQKPNEDDMEITKRLDVLIKLEIYRMKRELGKEFNLQEPARILQCSGFSPSEIAKLLDKNGPTAVAYLLYDKKAKKNEKETS
jgi:hypothetical protein